MDSKIRRGSIGILTETAFIGFDDGTDLSFSPELDKPANVEGAAAPDRIIRSCG
jgi:hypothetical protein